MSKTTAVALPAANAMSLRKGFSTFTRNPDLIAVATFTAVGFLVTILLVFYLPLRFPNLGALIEQYDQF